MGTPSTSRVNAVSEELTQDVALCLRSFHGTKNVVTYEKFCERFKKNFNYSIKEHLMKSPYTFSDVLAKVSERTRMNCVYDEEEKLILMMEKSSGTPEPSVPPSKLVSAYPAMDSEVFFYPVRPVYPYPLFAAPQPRMFPRKTPMPMPIRVLPPPAGPRRPLNQMRAAAPSTSLSVQYTISSHFSTIDDIRDYGYMGYPDYFLDGGAAAYGYAFGDGMMDPQGLTLNLEETADAQSSSKSLGKMEPPYPDDKTPIDKGLLSPISNTSRRSADERSLRLSLDYTGASDESYYWDALEELSQMKSPMSPRERALWERCSLHSAHSADDLEPVMRRSSDSFDALASLNLTKCASCSDLPSISETARKRRESVPELPALRRMEFFMRKTGNQAGSRTMRSRIFDSMRQGKDLAIKESLRRSSRQLDYAVSCLPNDYAQQLNEAKQSRIDAKKECLRLWGKKVKNLPELLCFLKLFHSVKGPMLINDCEYHIETVVSASSTPGNLSWAKYGRTMSVTRMFELNMFRLVDPRDRRKVQPVDCILKARYRMLRQGLQSELYNFLNEAKFAAIDEIIQQDKLPFIYDDEDLRREELLTIINSTSDVFQLEEEFVRLANDETFFVVTGISV
ncbi:unnamed protein product [Cylicocyclus nassatus]|uniref:Uncharacterized protein n=1 Tax=Cylicocyclus nassatus TaxID=53992 RepID=A0AA36GXT6_CYLNA|nr:unnamed protein product [Cylicocyclus nassatus]